MSSVDVILLSLHFCICINFYQTIISKYYLQTLFTLVSFSYYVLSSYLYTIVRFARPHHLYHIFLVFILLFIIILFVISFFALVLLFFIELVIICFILYYFVIFCFCQNYGCIIFISNDEIVCTIPSLCHQLILYQSYSIYVFELTLSYNYIKILFTNIDLFVGYLCFISIFIHHCYIICYIIICISFVIFVGFLIVCLFYTD